MGPTWDVEGVTSREKGDEGHERAQPRAGEHVV